MKEIRLSKSCLTNKEKEAVASVLNKEFLGMGKEVEVFENLLENFFNRPVVCVANGTAALHLAIQCSGIGSNDEVLVQSITYLASAQAITATGAKPIFCEVDQKTLTIDIDDAEKRINKNTKAIMPVHYGGGVGELNSIYEFAKKHNLVVIEDAAHAFGTNYEDNKVGSFGDVACFSFDGIKNITSGEGGCIVTDNEEMINNLKDARLLGVHGDTKKRYSNQRSWNIKVTSQGWRYHMSNIMAAIGIEQLKRFEELSSKRKNLAKTYDQKFLNVESLNRIGSDFKNIVPHIYPIMINKEIDRDKLRANLAEKNIQTGIHYFPNHLLEFFNTSESESLQLSEEIYTRLISLPLHPDLSSSEVEYVAENLLEHLN